jgi:hypothetical protein
MFWMDRKPGSIMHLLYRAGTFVAVELGSLSAVVCTVRHFPDSIPASYRLLQAAAGIRNPSGNVEYRPD